MSIKFFQEQYFTCINCGKCCGIWEIPITQSEKERLEKLAVPGIDFSENRFFEKNKKHKGLYLIGKKDGHCVFLGGDNLCVIHKAHGEKVKPLACRIYPFDIFNWEDETSSTSLRYDCPGVTSEKGRKINCFGPEINSMAGELSKKRKLADASYNRKLKPKLSKLRIIASSYKNFLLDTRFRPSIRIFAAAKLIEFHSRPENASDIVDAGNFFSKDAMELVKRSIPDLENIISAAKPLNLHEKMIFRFIIGSFIRSDEEYAMKFLPFARISRVKEILKFSLGSGSMGKLSGNLPDISGIDSIEAVKGMKWDEDALDVYWNYIGSKLESMHFCGSPCLGFTFEEGMRHLVISYPVLTSISALAARADKRGNITREDVTKALSVIDHTFARSHLFAINYVRKMTDILCTENALAAMLKDLP
ncbi:MAG TPA: hypothetical protein DET40_02645 [Lentisphaeria bacterium]|nr:MAG: hypothetical protein A2X45_15200 [Lentisphaerae bacterium GWF2_50_93]HCE42429.1 hypothetical protein [Lentisphaeria bacterium]